MVPTLMAGSDRPRFTNDNYNEDSDYGPSLVKLFEESLSQEQSRRPSNSSSKNLVAFKRKSSASRPPSHNKTNPYDDERIKNQEHEAEVTEAMRERLAQCGFQNNQISALIHSEEPQRSNRNESVPVYPMIRKEHMGTEIMHRYGIPFQDTDVSGHLALIYLLSHIDITVQNPDYSIVPCERIFPESDALFSRPVKKGKAFL